MKFKLAVCIFLGWVPSTEAMDLRSIFKPSTCAAALGQTRETRLRDHVRHLGHWRDRFGSDFSERALAESRRTVEDIAYLLADELNKLGFPARVFQLLRDVRIHKVTTLALSRDPDRFVQVADTIFEEITGLLYEALVANRLRDLGLDVYLGRSTRSIYPDVKWTKSQGQKEFDAVLRDGETTHWIEVKVYARRPSKKASEPYPHAKRQLLKQLDLMNELAADLKARPKMWLILPVPIPAPLSREVTARGIEIVYFPLWEDAVSPKP